MSRKKLIQRTSRNAWIASVTIVLALAIGMVGYRCYGEDISWAQAFADASMILSGQGPLDKMNTTAGHLFEGIYALVCGFLFFAVAGFALAPALHHILHRFYLEDEDGRLGDQR